MEAQRWEKGMTAFQLRSISILQDREISLRQRFLRLGRFFVLLEARSGKQPPGEELLDRCLSEAAEEKPAAPREGILQRLLSMAELMAAVYETEYPPEKLEELARRVAEIEPETEEALHSRYGYILENLAVNEFFLRLYPFACGGGFLANFKLFALRFRLAEFSLLLAAATKNAVPDREGVLTMLAHIMEHLDHSREADRLLQSCVTGDLKDLSADEFLALL